DLHVVVHRLRLQAPYLGDDVLLGNDGPGGGQQQAEQRYQADVVFDGADGLDYALTGQYDAIVLDVMLPKVGGFEVASRLRCAHVSTPILMLTARD
ncbi:response regulator, partial [Flavonifractor plautii]|uniref:response regulator n=1 Tax=Flavonifractor plautii TaxID=292800 RepID=UPI00210D9FD3